MNNKEIEAAYNEMVKMFPDLPNFEHYPRQFAYYVRLYKYYKSRQNENSTGE